MTMRVDGAIERGDFTLEITDVTMPPGVTAVVGPNGSGKTTFTRLIAGLEALDRGEMSLHGTTLDSPATGRFVPAHHRPVAVVFQDHRLFPHISAAENVAFPLRRRGIDRTEARRRARDLLDRVGLGARPDARPAELSGGERQRVAVARALAREPEVLVLDEPLASVDDRSRADLRVVLARSSAAHTVLVTHDPVEARELAGEVLVLDRGRSVRSGPVEIVAGDPGSRWAAEFLGANVVAGQAHELEVTTASGFSLTLAEPALGPVHVMFPASAVTLHARRPEGSARNSWSARVERVDAEGTRTRVSLTGPIAVLVDVTTVSAGALRLRPGTAVWASVKATEIRAVPR